MIEEYEKYMDIPNYGGGWIYYDQPNNRHNDKAENADHLILGHDPNYNSQL